jgi:hypothetical protein
MIKKKRVSILDQPCKAIPVPHDMFPEPEYYQKQEAEKETAMCTAYANTFAVNATTAQTPEQDAKLYLIRSLDQAIDTKRNELQEAFGMNGEYPRTLGDLKKYVESGWVKIAKYAEEEYDDDYRLYSISDYIEFRNPDFKTDGVGFKKAAKQMTKDASDVKDAIVVFGPEKGLEALNTFKEKTYS